MIEVINQEPAVTALEFVNDSVEIIITGGIAVLVVCAIASAVQKLTEQPKIDVE